MYVDAELLHSFPYCCSQTIPMRFDIDDIGKKTKHHAAECSRYLLELDKVCNCTQAYVYSLCIRTCVHEPTYYPIRAQNKILDQAIVARLHVFCIVCTYIHDRASERMVLTNRQIGLVTNCCFVLCTMVTVMCTYCIRYRRMCSAPW